MMGPDIFEANLETQAPGFRNRSLALGNQDIQGLKHGVFIELTPLKRRF